MSTSARRTAAPALLLVAVLAFGATGCAANDETPTAPRSEAPTAPADDGAGATPTAEPAVFRMPATCADAIPAERVALLSSLGMELLAGPDGKYGDDYLADPTPEQLAGGITCIWGEEDAAENSITISVAPVTPATRGAIVDGLVAQSLNIVEDGELVVYARLGDPVAAPAIVNLLRPTSWISVIPGLGGEEHYELAVEVAEEVSEQVGAE